MGRPKSNVVGLRYGHLEVLEDATPIESGGVLRRRCLCRCDCGRTKVIRLSSLKGGTTVSCGCTKKRGKADKKAATWVEISVSSGGKIEFSKEADIVFGAVGKKSVQDLREKYIKGYSLVELERILVKTDKSMTEEVTALQLAIQDYKKVIEVLGHEP